MKKGCGLLRAFVTGKGGERFGAAKSMENMGSLVGIILLSHCLGTSVDKWSSFVHSSLRQTAL